LTRPVGGGVASVVVDPPDAAGRAGSAAWRAGVTGRAGQDPPLLTMMCPDAVPRSKPKIAHIALARG